MGVIFVGCAELAEEGLGFFDAVIVVAETVEGHFGFGKWDGGNADVGAYGKLEAVGEGYGLFDEAAVAN